MATMPVVPPAPALFSITNCWPSRRDIRSANMRANTSVLPPAANGTTTVTGLEGQTSSAQPLCTQPACTHAVRQLAPMAPTTSPTPIRFISGCLLWLLFQYTNADLYHTWFPDPLAVETCDGMTS